MINNENYIIAADKIDDLFALQVVEGKQSEIIGDESLCCGQFIGKNALGFTQRGLHGTAAALRVLADNSDATRVNELKKVVNYIENRISIEEGLAQISKDKLLKDQNNIIKTSETLYALSFLKVGTVETDKIKKDLSKTLLDSKIKDKGWGFYTDISIEDPLMFPTSFVVLGLNSNGYYEETQKSYDFLKNRVINLIDKERINSPSLFAETIFALYALSFAYDKSKEKEYKNFINKALKSIFNSPFLILDSDIEQHLEYQNKVNHDYIRVPWQLYLMAICAKYKPRKLSTKKMQERIKSLLDSIDDENGFVYTNYGTISSARTNGIAYDVIKNIVSNYKTNLLDDINLAWDKFRIFLGHIIFKWLIKFIIFVVYIVVIVLWALKKIYTEETDKIYLLFADNSWLDGFVDLAPELLGPIILGLYAIGKRN